MNNKNKYPQIKILKVTDNPDGSADIDFEYGKDFEQVVKKHLKLKKNPTKKQISNFLLKCIKETAENEIEKKKKA